MKFLVLFFVNIFVTVNSASVERLNGVSGIVKCIEFDSDSNAFIVSELEHSDRIYKLDPQNQIILSKDLPCITYLKLNSKNDVFIFDQSDAQIRNIWMLSANSFEIKLLLNYSAASDFPAFFDADDHLFLETASGIGVLLNDTKTLHDIPRWQGYHLGTKEHSFDALENVYIRLKQDATCVEKIFCLTGTEKVKQDPKPYSYNLQRFGGIRALRLFNESLYIVHDDAIIRYKYDDVWVLHVRKQPGYGDFYAAGNRIFVRYMEDGVCYVKEITSSDTLVDTEVSLKDSCNIIQTTDKFGTVFFASSDHGSTIQYVKANGPAKKIGIPNSHYIYGLTTDDNGNLWILTRNLHLVPYGQTEAVVVPGLPYNLEPMPFKAKPMTNTVFIGTEDGVYIGSS